MPKFKVYDEFYKKEYTFEVWDLIDIIHRLRLDDGLTFEELKLLDFLDRIDKSVREIALEKINA